MFAIIDSRSSARVITTLKEYVKDVFAFQTNGLTYDSISGHPDIFIYQDKDHLVVAPNAPAGNVFSAIRRKSAEHIPSRSQKKFGILSSNTLKQYPETES